jgi:hypothetical protein
MRPHSTTRRNASALVWITVIMTALIGFCSLAVDFGRVQVVKTELSRAADAAARYAGPAMGEGIAAVRARAKDAADDNTADGTPVVLADADVEQGRWVAATRTFVANGTPADAVRITARRAGPNAVPLMFARVFGKRSIDVSASAIVLSGHLTVGFVGLNGIEFHNNAFVGSCDSSSVAKPVRGHSTGKGLLASNGPISAHNNTELDGDVTLGPSGSVSSISVDGSTRRMPAAIAAPAVPAAGTGVNPLGLPAAYTVSAPTTPPGGTYRFTSLTVNANLSFSGPAVVYVDGNIANHNTTSITAFAGRPSNLKIYQTGTGRTFHSNNNIDITATIVAPGSDFVANNQLFFYGTALFRSIQLKNNAHVFVDDRAVSTASGAIVQ